MNDPKPPFARYFIAALLAGVAAGLFNFAYYFFTQSNSGLVYPDIVSPGAIIIGSLAPILLAGIFYYALSRLTKWSTLIFILVALIFTGLSFIPPLQPNLPDGSIAPEGFFFMVAPMHVIAGLVAILILPWYVNRTVQ